MQQLSKLAKVPYSYVYNVKTTWAKKQKISYGSGGIRTHASEETGALNQRLRPLGHATFLVKQARKTRSSICDFSAYLNCQLSHSDTCNVHDFELQGISQSIIANFAKVVAPQ